MPALPPGPKEPAPPRCDGRRSAPSGSPKAAPAAAHAFRPPPPPPLISDLTDACGIVPARALAKLLGGTRLKVPRKARAAHPIAQVCGLEVLEWLVERHGGCAIDIPLSRPHPISQVGPVVARMTAEGASARDIARRFGVTERTVREWRQRMRDGGGAPAAEGASAPGRKP